MSRATLSIRQISGLLTQVQRRAAVGLFGLMIGGALLETLSVGLLIPALALLVQPDFAHRHAVIARALRASGGGPNALVIHGMLALVVVYIVKTVYLAFSAWRQNDFTFSLIETMSDRLFARYLGQPYTFHLERNSAELIRNIVGEVDIFANGVVSSGLLILSETLVLVAIVTLVMVAEPLGACIVALVTGLSSFLFYRLSRPHTIRWGSLRQEHAGLRFQHLQQGLGGVKDVKLLGREAEFLDAFRVHNDEYGRVGRLQNTLLQIPRLWLELLVVAGLAALVAGMLASGRTLSGVLPTLGLFGAAAFRIMPSMNRVLMSLQSLRFGLPVVGTLREELAGEPDAEPAGTGERMAFRSSVVFDHVTFYYAGTDTPALADASLEIRQSTMVGFIGQSGAGKSTLVDLLLGLLTPGTGQIRSDGVDIQTDLRGWQDNIGYVPQSIYLTDDTLRRNVAFGIPETLIDDDAVRQAIRAAQLDEFVRALPLGLDTVVGERGVRLSGGQRQRIGIARALYHDPPILVLDEATSALDTATEHEVMEAVGALHGAKTIVIVSHRLSTVEACDYLFRLEGGRIVECGSPADLLQSRTLGSR